MKLRILRRVEKHIIFQTASVQGLGVFAESVSCKLGVLDVEIDVAKELIWGKNVWPSASSATKITHDGRQTAFTVKLLSGAHDDASDNVVPAALDGGVVLLDILEIPSRYCSYIDFFAFPEETVLYPTAL